MKHWVLLLVVLVGMLGNAALAQEVKIPLPEGAMARLGTGWNTDVTFSPDGRYLAVATSLGIELRNSETLELIRFFSSGQTSWVRSVAFSPDGHTLASGSGDKTIKLWNVESGSLIRTLSGHTEYVSSVAFSPDGKTLASASYDNTIKLWNATTGTVLRTLSHHTDRVLSVAFSPDGKILASGSYYHTIRLWDVASGTLLRTLSHHTDQVLSVAFSPDGTLLASGSCDDTIKLWNVVSGSLIRTLSGHTEYVSSVAFSPDGKTLASGSWDDTIKLWDVTSGKLICTLTEHTDNVYSVAFSPDGKTLASVSGDKTIKLWNVASGSVLRTVCHQTDQVHSVTFSLDGKTLASGSRDGTVVLWNVESGSLFRILSGHTTWVYSVAFSPDGRTLASGSGDKTIKLWNVESGRLIRTLSGHKYSVYSVAFSPDGRTLASGSGDKTIKLWNVESGSLIRTLSGHTEYVSSVVFSSDGKTLASGSGDETIKLWDVKNGKLIRTFSSYTSGGYSVYSPNRRTLAEGSGDGTIRLWDAASGSLIRTLSGYKSWMLSVCFSPDGRTLASGSKDTTIKLWNVSTGSLIRTLTGHSERVYCVVFSSDGKTLASGGADATILLWGVDAILYSNRPPIAHFTTYTLSSTGARLVVQPRTNDRVWFDASGSSDPDGSVVKYEWDWESNGSYDASSKDPAIGHMFTTPGAHKVTLQVTDDKGGTATVSKTLTVGEKQPPTAQFTYTPASPTVLDTMYFTDSSSDANGEIKKWLWFFGDGTTSTEENPSHKYTQKKTFTVTLTVTDDDGLTDTATKQLTVINLDPSATFTFTPSQPHVQQPVSFDASSSTDKDGTITVYAWDFGDGSVATGKTTSHTFIKEGTYTVVLTVTDNDGATATQEDKITVVKLPPGPPKFNDEWGLVVGIANYEDASITDLKFTENDAQAFYNFLVDRNGSGFPKDHVRLLLGKDATLIGMRKGLDWLSTVAGTDDLVVFYFAGHGTLVPDKNDDEAEVDPKDTQDECLVPYDADWSSLTATTLVDDAIGYWFSNLSSQHVLMAFDSCFSGGASRGARTFGKGGSRAAVGNQVFTDMAGAGRLFLAASQADQSSYEYPELGHGVFTYFLLRGLGDKDLPEVSGLPPITKAEADKDGDGRVTVEEMKDYLDEKVPPFVRQHEDGGEQTPVLSGDEGLRNVRLNGYGVPLIGEVTAIQGGTVIISLGTRQGIQPGDQFEVIRPLTLPDGTVVNEVEATIEVLYILGPNRAGCKIIESLFPIMVKDQVHPAS